MNAIKITSKTINRFYEMTSVNWANDKEAQRQAMNNAFGAATMMSDFLWDKGLHDKAKEIENLWENEWRPKFVKLVWGA